MPGHAKGGEAGSSLVVRRRYAHPASRVFAAFASGDALQRWLAPAASIETRVLAFEFRVGAGFRMHFTLPDGTSTTLVAVYERIEEPDEIALTWEWQAPDPHAGIQSLLTVEFEETGGATELVLTHERLDLPHMRTRHLDGWRGTLERLALHLQGGTQAPDLPPTPRNTDS